MRSVKESSRPQFCEFCFGRGGLWDQTWSERACSRSAVAYWLEKCWANFFFFFGPREVQKTLRLLVGGVSQLLVDERNLP